MAHEVHVAHVTHEEKDYEFSLAACHTTQGFCIPFGLKRDQNQWASQEHGVIVILFRRNSGACAWHSPTIELPATWP